MQSLVGIPKRTSPGESDQGPRVRTLADEEEEEEEEKGILETPRVQNNHACVLYKRCSRTYRDTAVWRTVWSNA